MEEEYILDGKIYTASQLSNYAKQSNLSLEDYIYESGATVKNPNKYILDGKTYTDTQLKQYAKMSNIPLEEYIYESGATPVSKKKVSSESTKSQEPQAGTMASPSEDGSSGTPPISNKNFELTSQDLKDIGKKQPTDMSGKPLLPKVDAKLMKSIAERPKPLEKIEKRKSYSENIGTALTSAANDVDKIIASIPETLYNLASFPQNAIAYATGLDISTTSDKFKKNVGITNPVLDYYKEEGKKLEAETAKFNQENYKSSSIYQNIEEGNYRDAFELLGTGIARSSGTSIAIMAGGSVLTAAELATLSTAAFYNQNLEELQEENPDASDIENNIKALGMSAAESVFSSIGQGQIGAVYRDIIRKEGVEVGQKVFKDGLIEMYKGALTKYGVPVGLMGEGIEESATQITQNMISGKPAFQGAADAFILGGGSGVMFTAPISLKNANDRINNKVKEVEDKKKINLILDGSTDGLNKVFDVAKDSEINEKQLSIASLDKSRDLLVKELDRGVKKGEITQDQAKQSLYVFDKTKQITGQLRGVDINEKSKVAVANLLKERESLSEKIQGKDEALSVLEKQRIAEINEEIKQTILKSKEDAIQEQTTDESVLRTEQPELGLQEVGEGNAQEEVVTEQATQEVTPSETIIDGKPEEVKGTFLENVLDKIYEYTDPITGDKLKGNIFFDGQEVVFTDSNKEFSLGSVQDVLSSNALNATEVTPIFNISEDGTIDILQETDGIPKGKITPQGTGLKAIKTDKDGNVKRIVITDINGVTHSIKGELANDLAEVMMFDLAKQGGLTKKINNDETARETFNRGVREANAKRKSKNTQTSVQGLDRGGRVEEVTPPEAPTTVTETAPVEEKFVIDGKEYTQEEAVEKRKNRTSIPYGSKMEYNGNDPNAKQFVDDYNRDSNAYDSDGNLKENYIYQEISKAFENLNFRKFGNLFRKYIDPNFKRSNNEKNVGGNVDKNFTWEEQASYRIGDRGYSVTEEQFRSFAKEAGISIPELKPTETKAEVAKTEAKNELTIDEQMAQYIDEANSYQDEMSAVEKDNSLTEEEKNDKLDELDKKYMQALKKSNALAFEKARTKTTKETAPVDKIKLDIEASKERLKKAWDKYKTMGIAFDPKNNLARDRELVKSLVEYAYNNIRLGSYEASKLIKDLAEQGFEITRDGAKFIIDKASKKVQREINKTVGIKPKPTEQKRINKAYAVGVATQRIATEEAKAEIKDLKGQVVDVFRAGIQAIKIAQTTAKEKSRDIKTKSQELAKYLDNLKGKGKITSTQAAVMVKRFSKVNVLSEKSVNRFIDYATKVLNDANYNTKLNEARKTLSSLKKLSKNAEKNADLRAVASQFVKIDPSMVENIDEYNDIAKELKNAVDGSKIRRADTEIVDTVNINDVSTYVEKILTEQEIKLRAEKIAELQNLLDVDASKFSAEEIDNLFDIYGEEKELDTKKYDSKIVRAALNKAFDIYSTVINEMINTNVDPFTEEELEFTDSQKKIIREFMGIDLDTIEDNKEALIIIDSLINFIQNKSTAGMLRPIADYQAIVGGNELIRQKIEGKGIRKFWSPSFGKTLAEQFTSLNLLFEKEFKGFNAASKVRKMMGMTDLVNGKSIGQSEANRIVKKYVEQFYSKTANGEAFNSAYNDIERGVFAHVNRNVIGTEKRRKSVFEKRKQEVLEAIDFLQKEGNKEEKQLSELYKKAYDKVLDGSENIEDVRQKTDAKNVDGVNYWVNQWANKFDALSDLALNFYNKVLGRDLGFTPDRFKRRQGETKEVDLENDDSAFISNTDGVLYNKKSGSLMDKQENRKTPKGMFIDLSFDSKNSNSMYDAMIDLNTAFSIRKVQSFLNSENFSKIFKDDADLFKKRIASYVRLSRRKSPYTGSELSGLIQKLDKVATIGVTQALASPTQPFKQTIPVAASTLINAGSLGMGAAFNPSYNDWLDKLGYAISNRGIESRAEIESINRLLEKAASSKKEKAIMFVREANEKMLKWTLVNFDIWIARASFKAYYEQYLKKEGLYDGIPKKQSRFGITEIDYDSHEPNDDAADYAQEMIDRQQNISDYDLAGDLFTDKNSITKAFIKMLMAFSSFRMNQGSRLGADLTTLEYWNTSTKEDKVIALRSIAGYTAEQAVFRGLQITFGMMFYYAAKSLMGRGDDEEEDDKYKNNLIKASSTGAITDTFSPLPLLDPYVQNLSAASVDAIQDIVEIPEKDKIKLFEANKQEAVKALGVYGIVPERAGQIWDLGKLSYTRKFKDNYGKEKEISQEDADALKVLIGPYIASSVTGVLAPDVSSLVRKSIKIAEKGSGKKNNAITIEEYNKLIK
jgi:hypothetical protein